MIARLATPADKPTLSGMLDADSGINFDRDAVFVVEIDGKIRAVLASRNVHYVHDLQVDPDCPLARMAVDALLNYAIGFGVAAGQSEACLHTASGNKKFIKWLEEHGAKLEDGQIFNMELR
jgi:hypothetical protein